MEDYTSDPRGVKRAKCTECRQCSRYTREGESMKCSTCGHVPGKHLKVPEEGGAEEMPMDVDVEHASSHLMDQTKNFDKWPELNQKLQQCATEGCTQPVYYDNRLPMDLCMFEYCSPQCRDKDVLDRNKVKLKSDVKSLEEELNSMRTLPIASSSTATRSAMSSSKMPVASKQPDDSTKKKTGPSVQSKASTTKTSTKSKRKHVDINRVAKEDIGWIFRSDSPVGQVLITGMKKGSPVYRSCQNDQCHLLDTVIEIEKRKASPKYDESFIKDLNSVSLFLDTSTGVPPMAKLLSVVKSHSNWTHVFALRCNEKEEFGLSIDVFKNNGITITGVEKKTVSGLEVNDVIVMYSRVTGQDLCESLHPPREHGKCKKCSNDNLKQCLEACLQEKNSTIVLFVKR